MPAPVPGPSLPSAPPGPPTPSTYVELDRDAWRRLRAQTPLTLSAPDLDRLRGLGDRIDLAEVEQVYLPLTRLLNLEVRAHRSLGGAVSTFLGERRPPPPFVVGLAGSVAVGKSTTGRMLQELLSRWSDHPSVELVTTDGFLRPNAVLRERGLLDRKGFPESYDQRALVRFLAAVKAGSPVVRAPVYSHLVYDVVPGREQVVRSPDVLIVEGLNVLQSRGSRVAVSDFFDFSIYVDAHVADIRHWYVERFLALRSGAFADPRSYFHRYASLSDGEAVATAEDVWSRINEPNLVENILPTRPRARLVLSKGPDHAVQRVRLRRH